MPQYKYKARSQCGEVVEGLLESANRAAAMSQLKRDGLFPVSIELAKLAKPARGGLLFRILAAILGAFLIVAPIIMLITIEPTIIKAESGLEWYHYLMSIFVGLIMFIYGVFGIDKSNWFDWVGERVGVFFHRH